MNALANLFGLGGGSLISRLLGQQKHQQARAVCSFSFYGTIAVTFMYSLCCFIFMQPLLYAIGATENTISYASAYTFWVVVIGGIPATLSIAMAHLLRSEGYAKQASFGLGMGGIVNIMIDPLFMFVLFPAGNEVTGAAVATMFSNLLVLACFVCVFGRLREKTVLSMSVALALEGSSYWQQIFSVGLPSAIGSLLSTVSNVAINTLTVAYGDIPLAAIGIVKKIDMLPMNIGMGLCQGMMPLVAYNYAAQNYRRMKAVVRCTRISEIVAALVCIAFFQTFSTEIVRLFVDEPQTLQLGSSFLRICCLATPVMVLNFQMSYTFQAMGKGMQSLVLSSCRQGGVNIPLLFCMNALFGLYGIVWTQLLADGITMILSFLLYDRVLAQLHRQEQISSKG